MEEDKKSEKFKAGYLDYNISVGCVILYGTVIGRSASCCFDKKAEHAFEAALNKIRSSPDKLRQCWLMRDAIRAGVVHGPAAIVVLFGTFATTFVGIHHWLEKNRGVDETFNMGVAGTVSGATFGLIARRGPLFQRSQRGMMGAVVGACYFFPTGSLCQKLADHDKERNALRLEKNEQGDIKHVAGATMKDSCIRG